MAELSPKQKKFVAEYLTNGMNATNAAISAGYSKKTARTQGSFLLTNIAIRTAINDKKSKVFAKMDYSVERTLEYVGRLAFFDSAQLFESDGSLKPIHSIAPEARTVIAGLEVSDIWDNAEGEQKSIIGTLKKVKLSDRRGALDMLMRYHSLYKDTVTVPGLDKLAEAISNARKRSE